MKGKQKRRVFSELTLFVGDIIGAAIDASTGRVDFYQNGKHLGLASPDFGTNPKYYNESADTIYYPKIEFASAVGFMLKPNLAGPFL
ncbi:hypothetical protein M1146_06565 [Patescibacteria group bacterium]|nr:hypothetical protein [Patescibacteria group bacterium]